MLAEQAGLQLVLTDCQASAPRSAARLPHALPRLRSVAGAQLCWLVFAVAPLLLGALWIHGALLSEHDIHWYLATRPAEWTRALWLAAALALPTAGASQPAGRLQTHAWTVNDGDQLHRMIARGVDNLITDEPALLREVLAERAAMSDAELLLLALARRLRG